MNCLTEVSAGTFQLSSPQPVEYTGCVYVLATPTDLQGGLTELTPADGLALIPHFGLVLVTGYIFRAISQALNVGDERNQE